MANQLLQVHSLPSIVPNLADDGAVSPILILIHCFFREFPGCSGPQTLWILDLREGSLQALPGYLYQNLQIFQIQLLELQLVLLWHTCHWSLSGFFLQELLGPTMNRVYLWGDKVKVEVS